MARYEEDELDSELDGEIEEPESELNSFIREQLQSLPWWGISIIIHVIFLCLTVMVVIETHQKPVSIVIDTQIQPEPPEKLEPPVKKRDVTESEKEVAHEAPAVKDPVVKDAEESDHTETDTQEETSVAKGQEDQTSDSPLQGKFDNSAIGVGGSAGGAFGSRFGGKKNLVAKGGSKATENAVRQGLLWLKRHQHENGRWGCADFLSLCGKDPKYPGSCQDGAGNAANDVGVTGLALLCYLGAGNTTAIGEFKNEVRKGVKYLESIQDGEGCYGRRDGGYMYSHSIAALAMAEAYALSNYNSMLKTSAQKGIDFLVRAQNPGMGWRYTFQSGDNDTSVTGWAVMALKSAKVASLQVPDTSFQGAKAFIDSVTDPTYFKVGYTARGNSVTHLDSMTAVGMTARVFMGAQKGDPNLAGGAGLLTLSPPNWGSNPKGESNIDYYYWYYGTLAMFQMGENHWATWNEKMKDVLVKNQETEGCKSGSWPPKDRWSTHGGGRIYATTLNVLSLEIYYRYDKVFK